MAQVEVGKTVDVGGVDQGHAGVERGVNGRDGDRFRRAAFNGERHAAKTDGGDRRSIGAKGTYAVIDD